MGGGLKNNRFFSRESYAFEEIPCATFSLSQPLNILRGSLTIWQGIKKSRAIIKEFSPDIVVGFGSFFTLPVLVAAQLEKVPIVLHEQNSYPGKVNRLFSSRAQINAITFPITRAFLRGKARTRAVEVCFPSRKKSSMTKQQCFEYFGLESGRPVLLVFGGSAGASQINALFLAAAADLPAVQVLHFTGNDKGVEEVRGRYKELGIAACVKPFENAMEHALQIADLVVSRAGAATINELIEHDLPALLIPYPFAANNHQEKNGRHFVMEVGGGKMYEESALSASMLARKIKELLTQKNKYKEQIAGYRQQRKSVQLAKLIEECSYGSITNR